MPSKEPMDGFHCDASFMVFENSKLNILSSDWSNPGTCPVTEKCHIGWFDL